MTIPQKGEGKYFQLYNSRGIKLKVSVNPDSPVPACMNWAELFPRTTFHLATICPSVRPSLLYQIDLSVHQ